MRLTTALAIVLLTVAGLTPADELPCWGDRFLEIRLAGDPAPAAESGPGLAEEIDRAIRDQRRAVEEHRLRHRATPEQIHRYQAREQRADDVARVLRSVRDGPGQLPHAELVRRDIRGAQDRLRLERRSRHLERRAERRERRNRLKPDR